MLTATNSTEPPGVNPYLFEIEKRKKKVRTDVL